MGDETSSTMNLDLNLGPSPSIGNEQGLASLSNESVNLEDWIDIRVNRFRETLRLRARQRWQSEWRQVPIPPETRHIALELMANSSRDGSGGGGGGGHHLHTGEGGVSPEERNAKKTCEKNATRIENNEALGVNGGEEKGNVEQGSFFDCNVCLELAREPVVTCCGHLFCWPCIYQWLKVYSDAKECPVCKGKVRVKNVTPIYGRGNRTREPQDDSKLKIPFRPPARRVESWRQPIQRDALTSPMEEMIQRLGNRFDLARDLVQIQPHNTEDSARNLPERNNSLLNQILTSSGMRREQNTLDLPVDVIDVDLNQNDPTDSDADESSWLSSLLLRRSSHTHSAAMISNLTSALSSAERLVESYFRYTPMERNQEQPIPVDDRDSVSSIAAVIHSESQTVDTAVEIDSTVFRSTSSSHRRNDASRVSNVDNGDSRPPRRRRLN